MNNSGSIQIGSSKIGTIKIVDCQIFNKFPEITFGISTKTGLSRTKPYWFNMSFNVGDKPENVLQNRTAFFKQLGLNRDRIVTQQQVHSDNVTPVTKAGNINNSDALITNCKNLGLAVSFADCVPIFIYDPKNKVIAGVHSGWRGTEKKILKKTLEKMQKSFNSKMENLFAFIGPSISQKHYEVGKEIAHRFNEKYIVVKNNKFYLDLSNANYDMLLNSGIPDRQIEVSKFCTYENPRLFYSYRREGEKSGRAFGIIAMKDN